MKIRRCVQLADKITAELGFIVINKYRFHVIHVKTQRVTEKNNKEQRNRESQIKAAVIADQMIKFFADNGFESYKSQVLSLIIKVIKASFKSASGFSGQAPAIISAGLPDATILPSLIITILSQKRASSI